MHFLDWLLNFNITIIIQFTKNGSSDFSSNDLQKSNGDSLPKFVNRIFEKNPAMFQSRMPFNFNQTHFDWMIDQINGKQSLWKAGIVDGWNLENYLQFVGCLEEENEEFMNISQAVCLPHDDDGLHISDLPNTFDSRLKWPNCQTISVIYDQGECNSCWAVATASMISDRLCTIGNQNVLLSGGDLLTCCIGCSRTEGCEFGSVKLALEFFELNGIVTQACRPYPFEPCDHYPDQNTSNIEKCGKRKVVTGCIKKCVDPTVQYFNDKHFGTSYTIKNNPDMPNRIREEIFTFGPVEGKMNLYEDFALYRTGIYKHVEGKLLGKHAIRIIGWGESDGRKFWNVANSFNANWGETGLFRIVRGENECGIEEEIFGAKPEEILIK